MYNSRVKKKALNLLLHPICPVPDCHMPVFVMAAFPGEGGVSGAGIEPVSPELAGGLFTTEPPEKPQTDTTN